MRTAFNLATAGAAALLLGGCTVNARGPDTGAPSWDDASPPREDSSVPGRDASPVAADTGAGSDASGGADASVSGADAGPGRDAASADAGPSIDGIFPPDRIIDWTYAGVVQPDGTRGIPDRTAVCATIDVGKYGNGTTDVSTALQAAIDGCAKDGVVVLPAGTYLLKSAVKVSKPVVIRGAGPTTKIVEDGGNIQFGAWPGSQPPQLYQTNWTAGYARGTTEITLDDVSHLSVGQVIVLDQLNDTNLTTPGYVPVVNPTGNEGTVGVGVVGAGIPYGGEFVHHFRGRVEGDGEHGEP